MSLSFSDVKFAAVKAPNEVVSSTTFFVLDRRGVFFSESSLFRLLRGGETRFHLFLVGLVVVGLDTGRAKAPRLGLLFLETATAVVAATKPMVESLLDGILVRDRKARSG